MYKVGCQGYDKKNDTWKPITHLPMVKAFKESHTKDLEKLAADRRCEEKKTTTDDFTNTPQTVDGRPPSFRHNVLQREYFIFVILENLPSATPVDSPKPRITVNLSQDGSP
jgi:hypothetical protein